VTGERRQTRLLARTFFSRLFETELMPPGLPQERVVISVIALLAAPSVMLPLLQTKKYIGLPGMETASMLVAQDRAMALLLSMTATAFLSLAIWENIFPDRRDSRILGVLPIRDRTFVGARLLSIVALFALLFLLTTAMSSVAFGVLASMAQLPEGFIRVAAAHFLAVAAGQAFVFFGVVAVQCALLSVAGPVTAHRLAVALQMIIIIVVLQMPMVLPPGTAFALNDGGMPGWAGTLSASLLPPLWFVSLYQAMIGPAYTGTMHLTQAAALLGLGMPVLALLLYAASYRRLTRLAVEGRPAPVRTRAPWSSRVIGRLSSMLTAATEGSAVCAFTLRTLARSRQHRMLLAVWVGVALALTISAALPLLVRFGWSALDRPRGALLVGPLILAALVQTGMRSLFAIPVDIRANWAIRLRESSRLPETLSGAAAALIIAGVMPPALVALLSGTWLWGARIGLMHAIYTGAVALILVQVLVRGLDKIPFTCTYSPGTARITRLWPLYLTVFSVFTYAMAEREVGLLGRPAAFLITIVAFALIAMVLWRLRLSRTREMAGLSFEAQPDDALTVVTL
jgi:hypothetical protein